MKEIDEVRKASAVEPKYAWCWSYYSHASPYQVIAGVRRGTITRSISPSNSART